MRIAPFPHRYEVALEVDQLAAPPRAPVHIGAPPQFGGTDEVWSPEELLLGAALACAKTTFDALVARHPVPIFGWTGRITGVLDRSSLGPVFTSIRIDLKVATEAPHEDEVRELVRAVAHSCIISRALKTPIEFTVEVGGAE